MQLAFLGSTHLSPVFQRSDMHIGGAGTTTQGRQVGLGGSGFEGSQHAR